MLRIIVSNKKEKKKKLYTRTKYTVHKIENNKVVKKYVDVNDTAKKLNITTNTVRRLCNIKKQTKKYPDLILKYGEKITMYFEKNDI
jgi:hypothetical protein